MQHIKSIGILTPLLLILSLATSEASQSYQVKIGHSSPATNDRLEQSLQEFKKNVEHKTNGEVTVVTYPASQLGGEREQLEGVQLGSIEMAVLAGPIPGIYPDIMVFDLPYLFKNEKIAHAVLDGDFGKKILDGMLQKTGIRALAWGENGFRHFTNNVRKIHNPGDIKGLKIRTMENPAHMAMLESLGASPTPMAFGEVYSSLQQGVIDGQENPVSLIDSMRFYEVQKYLTLDSHVYNPFTMIINDNFFLSLPEKHRITIQEEAVNWSKIERQLNSEQTSKALTKLAGHGIDITVLSNSEKEQFHTATKSVYEKYRTILGSSLIDDLQKSVSDAEAQFPDF